MPIGISYSKVSFRAPSLGLPAWPCARAGARMHAGTGTQRIRAGERGGGEPCGLWPGDSGMCR